MGKLVSHLRIGEKIGLGFTLVGLLYLAAIWLYHQGQEGLIRDYHELQYSFVSRVNQASAIQAHLQQARLAEGQFLLHRQEADAGRVEDQTQALLELIRQMGVNHSAAAQTSAAMGQLAENYQKGFMAIVDAWRIKGLDENSGLQGAFRRSVQELQQRSRNFNASQLYVTLLQMRRGEKDLLLRGDRQYVELVQSYISQFRALTGGANFYPTVRQALLDELLVYETSFWDYAQTVLSGQEVPGGKGPFRDSGQRLEALLLANYVPALETTILEMRRREKDYLLRGDMEYVRMVEDIARQIRGQIESAGIATTDKAILLDLLANYARDFQALVAQNGLIAELTRTIDETARGIEPLIQQNLAQADKEMIAETARLAVATQQQARLNLLVVLGAIALGILATFLLTRRIVRPVREMAWLLNRLTYESPKERIATVPGARDEINAMAESLNTLADHRANFMQWWSASMNEAKALHKLHEAVTLDNRDEALDELRRASLAKVQQLNSLRGQMLKQTDCIEEISQRWGQGRGGGLLPQASQLRDCANNLRNLLKVTD